METTGKAKLITTTHVKPINELNTIIKLVINTSTERKGILRKAESKWHKDPWTIVTVHTNGTIRVQRGNKLEQLNIRRVRPFFEHEE